MPLANHSNELLLTLKNYNDDYITPRERCEVRLFIIHIRFGSKRKSLLQKLWLSYIFILCFHVFLDHPHHHHPHPHHHHHHHHPHPHGVAIGPMPNPCIGMMAAPTAGKMKYYLCTCSFPLLSFPLCCCVLTK